MADGASMDRPCRRPAPGLQGREAPTAIPGCAGWTWPWMKLVSQVCHMRQSRQVQLAAGSGEGLNAIIFFRNYAEGRIHFAPDCVYSQCSIVGLPIRNTNKYLRRFARLCGFSRSCRAVHLIWLGQPLFGYHFCAVYRPISNQQEPEKK